jgi:tetratricopeptide (TPR) repeat protein
MIPQVPSLSLALQYHQSGEFDAAAEIYREVLADDPLNADALHLLGLVALQAGNHELAVKQIQGAIKLKGGIAVYHVNLGVAYHSWQRFDAAIACFRQAIRLAPNNADAHNNLAKALGAQGDLKEAVRAWRRAVALKPNFDDALANLAIGLGRLGRGAESIARHREVLRLRPDNADYYNNLGAALNEQGSFDEAIGLFRQAIKIAPDFPLPYNNLGNALQRQRKQIEACHCYRRAIELKPDFAEAFVGLASTENELGNSVEAIQHYCSAIRIKPRFAAAHHNLGVVLQEQGDFAGAEKCFRAAIASDGRYVPAHADLAALLRSRLPAEDVAGQEELLADAALPSDQQAALHFGLAQVYDARGEYAQAAEHANTANALRMAHWRSSGQEYDAQGYARFVSRILTLFTPAFFTGVRDLGVPSQRPVFVVGLPRSGTTLIEQILASHSQVFGAGELTLARDAFLEVCGGPQEPTALPWDHNRIQELAQRHVEELQRRNVTALRVVDKLPENYHYLGYLATLFPRARFIHCRRDLRDTAVSCWLANFREVRWASDPTYLAGRFGEYLRFMDHWRQVLPAPILEISYEETVTDLEATARHLVSWCGLEWEAGCLDFHRARRSVRTASAVQVRQPLYATSLGRWKHYEQSLATLLSALTTVEPA